MASPFVSWTLQRNGGAAKTLAALNITNPVTRFLNQLEDSFSFTVTGDVRSAAPFAYADVVVLLRNGVRWFTGTVTGVRARGGPRESQWSIEVDGPWWQLSRTMYQQPMMTTDINSAGCPLFPVKTPKVVLFQNESTIYPVQTGIQIVNALVCAITAGVAVAIGNVPAFATVPFEPAQDLTVADVIRRCLKYTPDAVAWFDYSTATPTFNCQQRVALQPASFALNATPAIVVDFDLQSREDMIPTGVRFNYYGNKPCPPEPKAGCADPPTDGTTKLVTTITTDQVGTPDLPGGLIGTITLSQKSPTEQETPTLGLAALFLASLQPVQFEGGITLNEQECTGMVRVGNVVNLTGGASEWSTMNALVQQVEEILTTGTTKITVGLASHLATQDFVTLTLLTRNRAFFINSFVFTRAPGTTEAPNCDAGTDPNSKGIFNGLADGVVRNTDNAANRNALAKALTGAPDFQTKALEACKNGISTVVTVYGPA